MDSKLLTIGMIALLGVTGILLCVAALMPSKWGWPWFRYRVNLRWYKSSKKHLLYAIGGKASPPLVVVHGFNYLTGKIRMRHLGAVPGTASVRAYHANQIVCVVICNTLASESTIVE